MDIIISHKGNNKPIHLHSDATVQELQAAAAEAFAIDPSVSQKLIHRGKLLKDPQTALASMPLLTSGSSSKVQLLLGATTSQVAALHQESDAIQHRAQVVANRKTATPRNTSATAGFSTLHGQKDVRPRFLKVSPFPAGPATPFYDKRKALLEKLANDPAILRIMTNDARDLRVGNLTELHPHTSPTLLGLNENAGQQISLRLLTPDLEGIHSYNAARRVLIHELTHNIHSGHELPFKELDSKMAKEVAAYAPSTGHRLGGDLGEVYNPVEARRAESALMEQGQCEVAGGGSSNLGSVSSGGQRLGTSTDGPPLTVAASSPVLSEREARAQAAEKRRLGS